MNHIEIKIKHGIVVIQMFPEVAPKHCEVIRYLVEGGFYNGLKWHRVVENTLVQTGCPFGNGFGGINVRIPFEKNDLKHIKGACSMARGKDINSASSQFFICLRDLPNLDGKYTVWGQVIEGIEHLFMLKKGKKEKNWLVENDPDRIYYARLIDVDV